MNTPDNLMEKFKAYPIRVRIVKKLGNSFQYFYERGRKVQFKNGTTRLRLLKRKTDIAFPEGEYVQVDVKGRQVIDMFQPVEGELYPMKISSETVDGKDIATLRPVEKDVQFWGSQEYQRLQKKYSEDKDKWEKLMPLITIGIFSSIILVALVIVTDSLVVVGTQAASISGQLENIFNSGVDTRIDARIDEYMRQNAQVIEPSTTTPTEPTIG